MIKIVVSGPRGSGKTTVSRLVAKFLDDVFSGASVALIERLDGADILRGHRNREVHVDDQCTNPILIVDDSESSYATPGEATDWRVGLTVKPKYVTAPFWGLCGTVQAVMPSGTGGIAAKDGVLRIRLDSGAVILRPADEWVMA